MYVRTVKVINKFTDKIYLVVEIFESSTLVQLIKISIVASLQYV
jgi:hypothetical protein